MRFEAALDVVIDGQPAHVGGDGSSLVVETSDPVAFVAGVRRAFGSSTRTHLGAVADGLAANGASIHVEGSGRRFVTIGAGAGRRVSGRLFGSTHVAPSWRFALAWAVGLLRRRRR